MKLTVIREKTRELHRQIAISLRLDCAADSGMPRMGLTQALPSPQP